MPALIDLRRRIKSVRNTQQITQAMKTVATAKLKKAQKTVMENRPYWHRTPMLLTKLSRWLPEEEHPLLRRPKEKTVLLLVITSDKGLCGAFNSNLLEKTLKFCRSKAETAEVRLILIGKKASQFFKRHSFTVEKTYLDLARSFQENDMEELARHLIDRFILQDVDSVYVAYNEFKKILSPEIIILKLLPIIPLSGKEDSSPGKEEFELLPDFEPERCLILDELFCHYISVQIKHVCYESIAAEQAARMMAMENATRNAEDLISDLTLVMNKIRQATITKELLEIMTAVDALK